MTVYCIGQHKAVKRAQDDDKIYRIAILQQYTKRDRTLVTSNCYETKDRSRGEKVRVTQWPERGITVLVAF